MTWASLIAFALVFLTASACCSLLLGLGLWRGASTLRALGPRAERRAATLTLVGPPVLATVLAGVLAIHSARALLAGTDHCQSHAHHLHLCLVHGAAWATRPWAVVLLTVVASFVGVRLLQIVWAHVGAQRAAWRFRRSGEPLDGGGRAWLLPLDEPMVFTIGVLSPTIVVTQGAWRRLADDERVAVLRHELAHVESGDLWRRAVLAVLAGLAVPGLADLALRLWDRSAERICDRRAAESVGQPAIVAGAIVTLARMMAQSQTPVAALFAARSNVEDRVCSLLDDEAEGAASATWLAWAVVAVGIAIVAAAAVFTRQLHHLLETVLG